MSDSEKLSSRPRFAGRLLGGGEGGDEDAVPLSVGLRDTFFLVGTLDDGLEAILNGHRVHTSHVRCYSVEEHRPHHGLSSRGLGIIPRRDERSRPCRPLLPVVEAGQRPLLGEGPLS